MATQLSDEPEIFEAARKLSSCEAREDYLQQVCGDNPSLVARLRALLRTNAEHPQFLEDAPLGLNAALTVSRPPLEQAGTTIGPFTLLQQLGEGGMGVVYLAEQAAPVRRQVALKIIKPGMDTREVIGRFETERQALAMMDHPNIAQVFEAGATHLGRPYFVMELVQGIPITEYCDQHRLSLPQRLELFITVCRAVQHAHHKGIIHRDIKPSNVMIALHDGRPVVKVIDFGIAKAIHRQATEKTLFTDFAQIVGTPLYMSREQAERSGVDVDTRTDVYSLGVLLYELLTGTTPFEQSRLRQASQDEIRRILRDEDPPRPSARLQTLESGQRTTITSQRQIDLKSLGRLLRRDLDWIVMRALEKERERRYETVNALALDVQRSLGDEPVAACPPSANYRLQKFARRNRGVLTFAVLAATALICGIITLAVSNSMIRAEQARTRVEQSRALVAQKSAEKRAEELRQGMLDLQTSHQLLERGRIFLNAQTWDDAHAALTRAIQLRPEYAGPWSARADLYLRLGLFDLATSDLARAYELQESAQSQRSMCLALLRLRAGDVAGYREVSARMRKQFHGTGDADSALDMVRTAALLPDPDANLDEQVELAQSLLAREPTHPFLHYVLGLAYYRANQFEPAITELREMLTLASPDWSARHIAHPILAMTFHRLGREAEARDALNETTKAMDEWAEQICLSNNRHWRTNQGAGNWPILWWDWLECGLMYREAKLMIDHTAPPDDPRLHVLQARAWSGLRRTGMAIAQYDTALKLLPAERQVVCEMHRMQGYYYGYRDWPHAAREFSEARQLMPDDAGGWTFEAIAQLAAGNGDGYRQLCASIVERFAATEDPLTAHDVVFCCVLSPAAISDSSQLIPLAHVAARLHHGNSRVVGAACYRAGEFAQAVEELEKSTRLWVPRAWEWCFLAMAHHQLGHAEQAQICLSLAGAWIDGANQDVPEDAQPRRQNWLGFTERFEFPLLYAEATALIAPPQARSTEQVAPRMD